MSCSCESECTCGAQSVVVQVTTPTYSTINVSPSQGGARGPQGIQGIQGIQGLSASIAQIAYVHTQGVSSSVWNITHNLNFYPNVTTMDSSYPPAICEGEIEYVNRNTITVTFTSAFSGTAYLS